MINLIPQVLLIPFALTLFVGTKLALDGVLLKCIYKKLDYKAAYLYSSIVGLIGFLLIAITLSLIHFDLNRFAMEYESLLFLGAWCYAIGSFAVLAANDNGLDHKLVFAQILSTVISFALLFGRDAYLASSLERVVQLDIGIGRLDLEHNMHHALFTSRTVVVNFRRLPDYPVSSEVKEGLRNYCGEIADKLYETWVHIACKPTQFNAKIEVFPNGEIIINEPYAVHCEKSIAEEYIGKMRRTYVFSPALPPQIKERTGTPVLLGKIIFEASFCAEPSHIPKYKDLVDSGYIVDIRTIQR
jgi:hypothetical protein